MENPGYKYLTAIKQTINTQGSAV